EPLCQELRPARIILEVLEQRIALQLRETDVAHAKGAFEPLERFVLLATPRIHLGDFSRAVIAMRHQLLERTVGHRAAPGGVIRHRYTSIARHTVTLLLEFAKRIVRVAPEQVGGSEVEVCGGQLWRKFEG